jgi:hypothetical protein
MNHFVKITIVCRKWRWIPLENGTNVNCKSVSFVTKEGRLVKLYITKERLIFGFCSTFLISLQCELWSEVCL